MPIDPPLEMPWMNLRVGAWLTLAWVVPKISFFVSYLLISVYYKHVPSETMKYSLASEAIR
jgi:hypothetical protein